MVKYSSTKQKKMMTTQSHTRNKQFGEHGKQLKKIAKALLVASSDWHLTKYETRILSILLSADFVTKEQMYAGLYHDSMNAPTDNIIDIYVSKLKQKLTPIGIVIKSIWRQGFYLENRKQWKEHLVITDNALAKNRAEISTDTP